LIIDFVLTSTGVDKTIVEYVGNHGYCRNCGRVFAPPGIRKYGANQLYGHGFKAFFVYHRIALRLPYESISEVLEEEFGEKVPSKSLSGFMRDFSEYYALTKELNAKRLLESPVIHADETPISIRGVDQYVWVFTDGKHVLFELKQTREATIVHDLLSEYEGILVSDFYPGYDSVSCGQQKCWVHLIRDLNNDLLASPFDNEYEKFVLSVRDLIIPIMKAVQEHGLKRKHLEKFKPEVERFYDKNIIGRRYKSELTLKYQNRFARYRGSLFTFLEHDDIPWHNNTAERAIRHLAKQKEISGSFHENGMRDYLVMLGIKQTCRFFEKSFFKFLFSGEKDIDKFK
jgi:hypothetical protein